jgi:hypothetical protein
MPNADLKGIVAGNALNALIGEIRNKNLGV